MVIENFYDFNIQSVENGEILATVSFDKNHPVYEGHFPQTPITPGVVQVLVIKELLEQVLDQNLQMIKSRDIKFLSMHNPLDCDELQITIGYKVIENSNLLVRAEIVDKERKILKFNGEFKSI
ncbi:MAG TPA: hypothetical protein VJ855_03465 [Marinilabiliaceae bacterium]|nr:hypothetical protein [Marinilabiliaceae bacterium]